jgi:TPR repeat protein
VAALGQAADRGDPLAQLYVGMLHEYGKGMAQEDGPALHWYRKSAQAGNAEAATRLQLLEALLRKEAAQTKRQQEAERRMQEVARTILETNRLVAAFDQAKAGSAEKFADLLALAKQGHSEAQNFVGACFLHGYGTEKDDAEATRWWVRSARQGNPNAAKNLDMLRRSGYLVEIIERSTK